MLAVLTAAACLRLPQLAARPMHADEANQAKKSADLYETGQYAYDADDHHGPSLYWLTLPALALGGVQDFAHSDATAYRLVPAVFGVALLLVVLLLADGLGLAATLTAALLTALSPTLVFYSRYYIQEMLLLVFTTAAIGCGWRYVRSGRTAWAVAAGAAVGLMHATKETWVLSVAAMVAALVLTLAWSRFRDGPRPHFGRRLRVGPLLAAVAAACLVALAVCSSFGRDWRGPWNSIAAYATYWQRGSQSGLQVEPWSYYFELLLACRPLRHVWAPEAAILVLAALGFIFSLAFQSIRHTPCAVEGSRHTPCAAADGTPTMPAWCPVPNTILAPSLNLVRFLAFYSLVLAILYAIIPYKTPWCAVGFLHGMVLVAAAGACMLVSALPRRPLKAVAVLLLAAGAAHLGWQSYLLNFRIPVDQRHPYGHSATSPDVLKLAERLEQLARVSPEGHDMPIHVVVPENYWPLPWYLRRFNPERVGYWRDAKAWRQATAAAAEPAVVILSPEVQEEVDAGLRGEYNKQMLFGLRSEVFILVYVRADLWQAMLATKVEG